MTLRPGATLPVTIVSTPYKNASAKVLEGEDHCTHCDKEHPKPARVVEDNFNLKIPPPQGVYNLTGKEMSLDELDGVLGSTIKYDSPTKKILFLGTLLNYTDEDQLSFAFTGPPSTGKTYIALKVTDYFPQEDLMHLAYVSPTAFFHSQGILIDENLSPMQDRRDYVEEYIEVWEKDHPQPEKGKTAWSEERRDEVRRLKAEWDRTSKFYMVDLEKKILVFLDQPHDELLKKLRPLLSHDKKLLQIKITDKTREGGHKTKDIIIVGYPTVMFLSVNTSLEGQERTRNFLLSPEITQPKLKSSILQLADHLSDRTKFKDKVEKDKGRIHLRGRIQEIKDAGIKQILIAPEDWDYITNRFLKEHNHLEPRHQRDFPRLIAMIKAHALLNMFNRERMPNQVFANRHDCDEGYKLYKAVSEANEQGVPPHIYKFWINALKPQLYDVGLSRKEVSTLYLEHYRTRIGEKALKKMIEILCDAGFIYEAKDPGDKRFIKIYPLGGGDKNKIKSPGDEMKDEARALLEDNENSLDTRQFFKKMNGLGYHNKDINAIVLTDPGFEVVLNHVRLKESSDKPARGGA